MKRFRKALSLLIAFLIPFSSIHAFGLEFSNQNETSGNSETVPSVSLSPFEFVPEEGDLTLEELKKAELDRSDVPFEITYELAQSRLHVNRLYRQEPDDYTVMFQNRDGSKTVYVFSEKVKGRVFFSQGRPEDTKEIEIVSGQLVFNRVNKALSRLDSRCDEKKLFYYNIGHADIQYFNGRLSSGGTDITDDVREWTSGRIISGRGCPSEAISEIAPSSGQLAFSYTYSEIAGVVSLKNYSTNTYLRLSGSSLVMSPSSTPDSGGRWIICYQNTYLYKIILVQSPAATEQHIVASYDLTSIELSTSNQTNRMYWIFDSYSSGNNPGDPDYYYIRPYASQSLALNSTLGFTGVSSGSQNNSCGWILDNRIAIASYIGYQESAPLHAGAPLDSILTISPTGAMTDITWYYSTGNEVGYDSELGEYRTIETDGIYKVRFSEWYSGIAMDPGEDEPINVVVYGNTEFNARATYMIRPTNYSNLSRTLRLSSTSATVTSLSISDYSGNVNNNYKEKWDDKSRTFTIETLQNGKNRIAATLPRNQYSNRPNYNSFGDNDEDRKYNYNLDSFPNYTIIEQAGTNNYISSAGATSGISGAGEWYIVPVGTMTHTTGNYNKYAIVKIDSNGIMSCFKWTSSDGVTCSVCSADTVSLWVINKVGIHVPFIQQTRTYYCGYATLLQAIYGAGTEQALINSIASDGNLLHNQQEKLKTCLNYSLAMSQYTVCDRINSGSYLPSGVFDKTRFNYNRTVGQSVNSFHGTQITNTKQKFINVLTGSFETGWIPFMLTETAGAPYNSSGNAHYISIVGYDSVSDTVLLSNCHFGNITGGIYSVDAGSAYNNIYTLFYSISVQS